MKYRDLLLTHSEYHGELWETIRDLYRGGFHIIEHAGKYLPRETNEDPSRYQDRIKSASYRNYMGLIIDAYVSELFSRELVVSDKDNSVDHEFWREFGYDANLEGDDFSSVLRESMSGLLTYGKALVACDFPAGEVNAGSRAEEDAMGLSRGYCYDLDVMCLTNWGYSHQATRIMHADGKRMSYRVNRLKWAITRKRVGGLDAPGESAISYHDVFTVWTLSPEGFAEWKTYEVIPGKDGGLPDKDAQIPVTAQGITSFREIPIVEIKVPDGLWIGNKLGPLALDYFRKRSALIASQKKSLFALPVVYLGDEIGSVGGSMPAERATDPSRGDDPAAQYARKGFMVMGAGDKVAFESPDTSIYSLVDKQLKDDVDEMFRVGSQIASGVSAMSHSLGRSGSSKKIDRHGTLVVLTAYAAIAKDAAQRVYGIISDARGESSRWVADGMDNFDQDDRGELVAEASQTSQLDIPSPTFWVNYKTRIALALLGNTTDEIANQVREELTAAQHSEANEPRDNRNAAPPQDNSPELTEAPDSAEELPSSD